MFLYFSAFQFVWVIYLWNSTTITMQSFDFMLVFLIWMICVINLLLYWRKTWPSRIFRRTVSSADCAKAVVLQWYLSRFVFFFSVFSKLSLIGGPANNSQSSFVSEILANQCSTSSLTYAHGEKSCRRIMRDGAGSCSINCSIGDF